MHTHIFLVVHYKEFFKNFNLKKKGEIKILTQKCSILDEQKSDSENKFELKNKELEEYRSVSNYPDLDYLD